MGVSAPGDTALRRPANQAVFSPRQLADALGLPPPTAEQEAIITAPAGPALVVAGAGAGKTETMAARVVWMVANRLAEPAEVLGLTFTRKAAQQLSARIRARLARLAGAALLRDADPAGELREILATSEAEVSTYHAYAGRLLSEYGLLLPLEPATELLSETQLWQVAHQAVLNWDAGLDTTKSPAGVTAAVLALSGQLAEHLVTPDELRSAGTELDKLVHTLPPGPRQRGGPGRTLLSIIETQQERITLLPLVQRLADDLRARGALDFGAQMSHAARLATAHPEVGAAERKRVRLVLLDEYQDTGHAQRVLLSALFGAGRAETAVTAVGDPLQSIYGWRGASAANLPRFTTDFPDHQGQPAAVYGLMTSWRNPPSVLAAANHIAAGLAAQPADPAVASAAVGGPQPGTPSSPLRPRPGAPDQPVVLAMTDTVVAERQWLAAQFAAEFAAARDAGVPPPTAAVLVRRNADAPPIAAALRAQGIPADIAGLGGLLSTPEVSDVVAVLRLLADPGCGPAAMRLLTGARWQLGIADVAALASRARELSVGGVAAAGDGDDLDSAISAVLPDAAEAAGVADAIADPGAPERYSAEGWQRIAALGAELSALRERSAQPLPELVSDVIRTIGVAIEAQARSGPAGRADLDAFGDVVAGFAAGPAPTLPGLLSFLAAAEQVEDGLDRPGEEPGQALAGRVQILTVHAAKGLEWEVVAVPHLAAGVFPSAGGGGTWLGSVAELPPWLRGDRAEPGMEGGVPVPVFDELYSRADLEAVISAHKGALARRQLAEERRLCYVALTRTERALYISGHYWGESGGKMRGPSVFLHELAHAVEANKEPQAFARIARWDPEPPADSANPLDTESVSAMWPADPLGARRADITLGAELVLAALSTTSTETADDPEGWAADVTALLAEHAAAQHHSYEVELPGQLPATALGELHADPAAYAARLRRPLPYPPNPLARRGTAFHAWAERWFSATRLFDYGELPGAADADDAPGNGIAELQQAFLASGWASRTPLEVEVPFETTVAGTIIRGRMDAVFAEPGGGWVVVDWKTGAEPSAAEQESADLQLAVYRVAWARLLASETGEPETQLLEKTSAAFHYIRTNRTVRPARLPGPAELDALLSLGEQA